MTIKKQRLMQLRVEARATQVELAAEARLSKGTISLVESGKLKLKEASAWQLFYALNRLRKARGFPEVDFDDIDWSGEGHTT